MANKKIVKKTVKPVAKKATKVAVVKKAAKKPVAKKAAKKDTTAKMESVLREEIDKL